MEIDTTENINITIARILAELAHMADIRGDIYRASAFMKASFQLERISAAGDTGALIRSGKKITGVGKHIRSIIDEVATSGQCKELQDLKSSKEMKAVEQLTKILGVGATIAYQWTKLGIYTISDAKKAHSSGKIKLTKQQMLGLRYYDQLQEHIPHSAVASIGRMVIFCLMKELLVQNATIAGSYRRESESSGDIDVIFVFKNKELPSQSAVVEAVKQIPGFIDIISAGESRVSLVMESVDPALVVQVDILITSVDSYAAALLYFTGNKEFNEAMRAHAKKSGYLLNQDGLYRKVARGYRAIATASEQDIFNELKLRYIAPISRISAAAVIDINSSNPTDIINSIAG